MRAEAAIAWKESEKTGKNARAWINPQKSILWLSVCVCDSGKEFIQYTKVQYVCLSIVCGASIFWEKCCYSIKLKIKFSKQLMKLILYTIHYNPLTNWNQYNIFYWVWYLCGLALKIDIICTISWIIIRLVTLSLSSRISDCTMCSFLIWIEFLFSLRKK